MLCSSSTTRMRALGLTRRTSAAGSRTRTAVPSPGRLSSDRLPPWFSTTRWTVGSPSPEPARFVVKNGSKTRSSTSGAMPTPVSEIAISTYCTPSSDTFRRCAPPS